MLSGYNPRRAPAFSVSASARDDPLVREMYDDEDDIEQVMLSTEVSKRTTRRLAWLSRSLSKEAQPRSLSTKWVEAHVKAFLAA